MPISAQGLPIFPLSIILSLIIFSLGLVAFITLYYKNSKKESLFKLKIEDLSEAINTTEEKIRLGDLRVKSLYLRLGRYNSLKSLLDRLNNNLSLEDTADIIIEESHKLIGHEDAFYLLYLLDRGSHTLSLLSSCHCDRRPVLKLKNGDIFDEWVLRHESPLLVEDVLSDFRFDYEKPERPLGSLISAPLVSQHRAVGIIRIDSPDKKSFNLEDLRLLCTISDLASVTIDNALYYRHTQELAIKDYLTGLYTHNYILERLAQELERCQTEGNALSVLMVDVDLFKKYNDLYGHLAGDMVLRNLGTWLEECTKGEGAIIGRFGGEEFLVILPYMEKEKAFSLAEEIRCHIQGKTVMLRRKPTSFTVSIGVSAIPVDEAAGSSLLEKADSALYQAKRSGRNRVCLA